MTKVLYLTAWGRSGTTVMNRLFGEPPGMLAAGELHTMLGWPPPNVLHCGCGRDTNECPLWSAVSGELYGTRGWDPEEVSAAHRAVTGVARTRAMLRRPHVRYLALCEELYAAVASAAGARLVVDSTKQPSIAAVLASSPTVEAFVVHVVRDPRAVAFSWQRRKQRAGGEGRGLMPRFSPLRSSLNWDRWNLAADAVRRKMGPRAMLLRYEDFVSDPRAAFRAVMELVDEDPGVDPFAGDRSVVLTSGHTVAGNPDRFTAGAVELRRDDEWRNAQPVRDRALVTALTGPLLRRYGYRLSAGS